MSDEQNLTFARERLDALKRQIQLRIVGHHDQSIALHAACDFAHVGVEREVGRKLGQWLDVVLMQRLL